MGKRTTGRYLQVELHNVPAQKEKPSHLTAFTDLCVRCYRILNPRC